MPESGIVQHFTIGVWPEVVMRTDPEALTELAGQRGADLPPAVHMLFEPRVPPYEEHTPAYKNGNGVLCVPINIGDLNTVTTEVLQKLIADRLDGSDVNPNSRRFHNGIKYIGYGTLFLTLFGAGGAVSSELTHRDTPSVGLLILGGLGIVGRLVAGGVHRRWHKNRPPVDPLQPPVEVITKDPEHL